jgi:hypothetical protein
MPAAKNVIYFTLKGGRPWITLTIIRIVEFIMVKI